MKMTEQGAQAKKKGALVTGASSGIGAAVSRMLCENGYEVYGIGRDFFRQELVMPAGFHPLVCDVAETDALCAAVKQIKAETEIEILVNNAGVGYYGVHEELNSAKIKEMVRTNLEAPMILTNLLLRDFKRKGGVIINVCSVTARESNPHGCVYGATKAGLLSFSQSLFEEARKYGVKVVSVLPDMTKSNLYRNADFKEDEELCAHLLPEEVAEAVRFVICQREGMVCTELTLKPQLHRIMRKNCRKKQTGI